MLIFRNQTNGNEYETSNYVLETQHGSIENLSYYGQAARSYFVSQRSVSAGDFKDSNVLSASAVELNRTQETNSDVREIAPISVRSYLYIIKTKSCY